MKSKVVVPPLKDTLMQRQDVWSDSAGLQVFAKYGRIHVQFGDMVQLSAHEPRRGIPGGINVHLSGDGRLVIAPEVSNTVVLRQEDL